MLNNAANRKYLIGLLFVLSFLLFSKTLSYKFVWDDERIHLTNNEQLMKGNIASFWKKPYSGMYIPVSYTTWSVVKTFALGKKELSPKAFHILNVITHSINCILVFLLLLLLFQHQGNAFIGALLFLLHPLQVESVAWISEFRGLYSTLFSLASLLVLFRHLNKSEKISLRMLVFSKAFLLSSLLFVLALLSKPSAVVLPFVAGILTWCFYKEKFKAVILSLSIWLVIALPVLVITMRSQPNEILYSGITLFQRLIIAGDTLFFYFAKLLIPCPLVACYGYTPDAISQSFFSSFSTLLYIAAAVCFFVKRKQFPLLFSGFAIITVYILPVSGIIPFEYQKHSTVADRYMYFGMLGTALWIPTIRDFTKKHPRIEYVIAAILPVYFILTILQMSTWKNEFTVWDNTLKYYQNSPKVYYNRGVEYSKMKRYNDAISDYTQSLLLQPGYLDVLFNRANAYENTGNTNAAFADYNSYLSIDSTDGSVYFKKAYLNYRTGNIPAAALDVQKAEQLGFPVDSRFKQALYKRLQTNEK